MGKTGWVKWVGHTKMFKKEITAECAEVAEKNKYVLWSKGVNWIALSLFSPTKTHASVISTEAFVCLVRSHALFMPGMHFRGA
jgi:hypothetical protein